MTDALSNGAGGRIPNLAAHGLKGKRFAKVQRLAEELDGFWRQLKSLDEMGTQQRIRNLESELAEQQAHALRGGPEPDDTKLVAEKKRLEEMGRKRETIRRAVGFAQQDLMVAVAELGPEALAEVQEKAQRYLRDAEKAAQRLSEALTEADKLASDYEWLSTGGQRFTTPQPASVTVDDLIYERQRALGLVDVGVVG
jgi:transcriptional regulator of met regulon